MIVEETELPVKDTFTTKKLKPNELKALSSQDKRYKNIYSQGILRSLFLTFLPQPSLKACLARLCYTAHVYTYTLYIGIIIHLHDNCHFLAFSKPQK